MRGLVMGSPSIRKDLREMSSENFGVGDLNVLADAAPPACQKPAAQARMSAEANMLRRGSLAVPATVLLLACGTDLIEGTTGGLTGDDTASTGKTTPPRTPTGGETSEPTGGSTTGGETGEPTGGNTGGVTTGTTAQDTTGEPAATGTTGDETSGSDTTGAESGESGTGMPALCGENHVIKRAPTEATLSIPGPASPRSIGSSGGSAISRGNSPDSSVSATSCPAARNSSSSAVLRVGADTTRLVGPGIG